MDVRAVSLENLVSVPDRPVDFSVSRSERKTETKCPFRGNGPKNHFFEILAIPILKIYMGFPYQFFDFLDILWEFLTNFGNSDFENV